jgi:dihydropteroate synthase
MTAFSLRLADERVISLQKPAVMGIINVSPESFYRPYASTDELLAVVAQMVESGVDIIDIGGEATNLQVDLTRSPGPQAQIDRVAPVVERIAREFPVLISIDTSEPLVMRAAVACGAHLINDQRGLQTAAALKAAVELATPVCLMHFFSPPRQPGSGTFKELMATIKADLSLNAVRCQTAGIAKDRLILDPGFGQGHYGKNAQENYYILAHLKELTALGYPVLAGWSRKSMIGDILNSAPPSERLYGSIAAAALAAMQGAAILRVHDVAETIDAIKIFRAMRDVAVGEK